jgi:serine/threonine protein kinase
MAQDAQSGARSDATAKNAGGPGQNTTDEDAFNDDRTVISPAPSLANQSLAGGKYQIIEELGRGGMSVVYSANDNSLGRRVAVKVLLADYAQAAGPEAVKRFQQEARSVAKLSHPHIISIYEYGVLEDGSPYIVMDYVVGISLADEMEKHGLMDEARVYEILKQSAEALRHSHSQGVVHRDIKPSNLLLTRGDEGEDYVRVVDFGIAKMQDQDPSGKLTRTGQIFGSPLYMSPEQCEGLTADARSDIYSLGCVAYELITGRPPHMGKNAVETMHRKMTSDPTPFAVGEDHYRKEKKKESKTGKTNQFRLALQAIILKMLAGRPDDRQQTADQLLSEIKALKGLVPEKTAPLQPSPKDGDNAGEKTKKVVNEPAGPRATPVKKIVAGLAFVSALGAAVVFFLDHQKYHGQAVSPSPEASATKSAPSPPQNLAGSKVDAQTQSPSQLLVSAGEKANVGGDTAAPEEKENGAETNSSSRSPELSQWKTLEGAGQTAFMDGNLDEAGKQIELALVQADLIKDEEQHAARNVSLRDTIDLDRVRHSASSNNQARARYEALVQEAAQSRMAMDKSLLSALDLQLTALQDQDNLFQGDVNKVLSSALEQAKKETFEEHFGDAEQLYLNAVRLLSKGHGNDPLLATACHNLANVYALETKWEKAIRYADMSVGASQSDAQKELNLAQAYYLQGWAAEELKQDPMSSYNKALDFNTQLGARGDIGRLRVWRKQAQYCRKKKMYDEAAQFAKSGVELAEKLHFKDRREARRLEQLAYFYFVLGRLDDAIRTAREGLRLEDLYLPRQDLRVVEELGPLAQYYLEAKQKDMARHINDRRAAISDRLHKVDNIFHATSL